MTASGRSTAGPDCLRTARVGHSAVRLDDGRVLIVGGHDIQRANLTAEVYDPGTKIVTAVAGGTPALGSTTTLLTGGDVLVVGGTTCSDYYKCPAVSTFEIFETRRLQFRSSQVHAAPRAGHTASAMRDGSVLLAGGWRDGNVPATAVEIYDSTADRTRAAPRMQVPRWGHSATVLRDGSLLVAGGMVSQWLKDTVNSAEIFDPVRGTWTLTSPMRMPRSGHRAVLLRDGRVLVVGGTDDRNPMAEVFDPVRRSWAAAPEPKAISSGFTLTEMSDGRILASGGTPRMSAQMKSTSAIFHTPASAAIEVYDARREEWSVVARLVDPREDHTATLLRDGRVLIAGGYCYELGILSAIEFIVP